MATIGELIINLNASTAAFVTELNRVKNLSFDTATQIQRSFSLIGTAAMGMLTTFAGAAVGMIDHTIQMETEILHLSAAAGMTVQAMSGLAFVAQMFGMNVDQIASAMEKFDKQLIAAQLGNAKAGQNMSLLGIDPASITTSDQALIQLAAHFAAMPDGILKTGEAMLAFSKNGATMLEFLNQGPVAIQKYLDLATALGLVFDKDDAEAALHFKQNLDILQGSFQGFQIQLEKAILPNLTALTDALVAADVEMAKGSTPAVDAVKYGFQLLASVVVAIVDAFKNLTNEVQAPALTLYLQALSDGFMAVGQAATGSFDEAKKSYQAMNDELALAALQNADTAARAAQIQITTGQELNAIWGEGTKTVGAQQKALDSLTAAVKVHQTAVDSFKKSTDAIITSLQTQIATLGMSASEIQVYKILTDAAKLGVDGWAQSEVQLYLQLQKKLDMMQAWAALPTLTMEPTTVASKDELVRFTTVNDAFTDSISAQILALQYSEATFGMTADQIAVFNLRQLDGSAAAQAIIPALELEQQKMKALQDQAAATAKTAKDNADAWKMFGETADKSLNDLIFSGKSFAQVLSDITKQLGEMFLKWALFGFGNSSTSAGGGFFGMLMGLMSGSGTEGSAFTPFPMAALGIPGFAGGGPVPAGVPIMVGENGPEPFIPSTAGTILPSGTGMGPQINVVYNIDARGSSITQEQFRASLAVTENNAVQRALNMGRESQLRSA